VLLGIPNPYKTNYLPCEKIQERLVSSSEEDLKDIYEESK
jgi:hypothetical protein